MSSTFTLTQSDESRIFRDRRDDRRGGSNAYLEVKEAEDQAQRGQPARPQLGPKPARHRTDPTGALRPCQIEMACDTKPDVYAM